LKTFTDLPHLYMHSALLEDFLARKRAYTWTPARDIKKTCTDNFHLHTIVALITSVNRLHALCLLISVTNRTREAAPALTRNSDSDGHDSTQ